MSYRIAPGKDRFDTAISIRDSRGEVLKWRVGIYKAKAGEFGGWSLSYATVLTDIRKTDLSLCLCKEARAELIEAALQERVDQSDIIDDDGGEAVAIDKEVDRRREEE